jgi:tetratricopeptide (TPR) repeat protein
VRQDFPGRNLRNLDAATESVAGDGNARQEASARYAYGIYLGQAGDNHTAAKQFLTAARLYAQSHDFSLAARAQFAAAAALSLAGRFEESIPYFVAAASQLDSLSADEEKQPCTVVPPDADVMLRQLRILVEESWLETLVKMGTIKPPSPDSNNDVLDRCNRLLVFTAELNDPQSQNARFMACYYKAKLLVLRNNLADALAYAREAAEFAKARGDPIDRSIEVQMRIAVARALAHPSYRNGNDETIVTDIEEQLVRAAKVADELGDSTSVLLALRELARVMRVVPDRAVTLFADLAGYYRIRRSTLNEAVCIVEHASARDRTSHRPDLKRDLEISDKLDKAGRLFERLRETARAADAYYYAGIILSKVSLIHAEQRGRALTVLETAAKKFAEVENWHGCGVAQTAEAELLNRFYPGEKRDDALIERVILASLSSFDRAERPAEIASSLILLAGFRGNRFGATEQWMQTSVDAIQAYEGGRASRLLPVEREIADRWQSWGFLMIAATTWACASSRQNSDPRWSELVWGLDQVVKARSFRDHQLEPVVWQRFLRNDEILRDITSNLEQARYDLETSLRDGGPEMESKVVEAKSALETNLRRQRRRLDELAPEMEPTLSLASNPTVALPVFQRRLQSGEMYIGLVRCGGDEVLRVRITAVNAEFDAVREPGVANLLQKRISTGRLSRSEKKVLYEGAADLIGAPPQGIDTLFFCPDRDLLTVPWHLLPTLDGGLLGDEVTTVVIPAAGFLEQIRREGDKHAPHKDHLSYLGVADDRGGKLKLVDWEVQNILGSYFRENGRCLTTGQGWQLLTCKGHVDLLHLACHAAVAGLDISRRILTPADLADMELSAEILLLTGCDTGAFAHDENNECFGVVRQLLVATRAKAAIISFKDIPDAAGPLFSDLLVSALTQQAPDRPWEAPPTRLSVGEAVRWARARMRRLTTTEVQPLLPGKEMYPTPEHPAWWSPWFVVGNPKTRIGANSQ